MIKVLAKRLNAINKYDFVNMITCADAFNLPFILKGIDLVDSVEFWIPRDEAETGTISSVTVSVIQGDQVIFEKDLGSNEITIDYSISL